MAFSPVAWKYRDPILATKLAQMHENMLTHDHRSDGTQGAPIGRWAGDVKVETRAASGVLVTPIVFPAGRFTTPPNVTVTIANPGATYTVRGWGVRNVTTAGADVWIDRSNTGSATFHWTARQAF